jgi:hypothetical protein
MVLDVVEASRESAVDVVLLPPPQRRTLLNDGAPPAHHTLARVEGRRNVRDVHCALVRGDERRARRLFRLPRRELRRVVAVRSLRKDAVVEQQTLELRCFRGELLPAARDEAALAGAIASGLCDDRGGGGRGEQGREASRRHRRVRRGELRRG